MLPSFTGRRKALLIVGLLLLTACTPSPSTGSGTTAVPAQATPVAQQAATPVPATVAATSAPPTAVSATTVPATTVPATPIPTTAATTAAAATTVPAADAPAPTPVIVPNALPYTLTFTPKTYPGTVTMPNLQSFAVATTPENKWLIVGGRFQGLHTFMEAPTENFSKTLSNNFLWVIDPQLGQNWKFDLNQLPPTLSAPLQSTNQESYYDRDTDQMYIMGGYGWKADGTDMQTFNTLISFPVTALVNAIMTQPQDPQKIASLFQVGTDDRFAVTGGELTKLSNRFYLVFGQKFMGQYRAFSGGGSAPFTQEYTEQVRIFTLVPGTLKINSYGPLTSNDPDHPYHRRDGNIVEDIDPATGKERIAAYGGVFQPGKIAAYDQPVYITDNGVATVDRNVQQAFSQYECPVIPVYDDTNKVMYNTFFGGISHSYYFQTPLQHAAYISVTQEGRNDGFPFIADISTLMQTSTGAYKEYILPNPIPQNMLLGSSIPFILNPNLIKSNQVYDNGTLKLSTVQTGQQILLGYIYGGIRADNPLPLAPNSGTYAANNLFEVYLTYTPSGAIPADQGHVSETQDENLNRK